MICVDLYCFIKVKDVGGKILHHTWQNISNRVVQIHATGKKFEQTYTAVQIHKPLIFLCDIEMATHHLKQGKTISDIIHANPGANLKSNYKCYAFLNSLCFFYILRRWLPQEKRRIIAHLQYALLSIWSKDQTGFGAEGHSVSILYLVSVWKNCKIDL